MNETSCVVTYKQIIFYVHINTTGMTHLKIIKGRKM